MNTFQSLIIISFGIIIYMMAVDDNVSHYINLILKLIRVKIRRFLWWLTSNPESPLIRLTNKIKYYIIAVKMKNEFSKKPK